MAIYGTKKKQKLGKLILEDQCASKSFQEIRAVTVTGCREQGTGIDPLSSLKVDCIVLFYVVLLLEESVELVNPVAQAN